MMTSSCEAKEIMDRYFRSDCRDRDRLNNPITQVAINNNGRLAQIEMLQGHMVEMNDVDRARAERTLKQIGG